MYVHSPVLLSEVVGYLRCSEGRVYVDATIGEGGHAEQILEQSFPDGRLIGLDLDHQILQRAQERLKRFGSRVSLVQGNFKDIKKILSELGVERIDGFLADLGISSFHFENKERGFSFQSDAPLDMRLDQSQDRTAAFLVNHCQEEELARIIREYGEERWNRRIARLIFLYRQKLPILTTTQLSQIVVSAIPPRFRSKKIHPATKTFQALRIAVNEELLGLDQALIEVAEVLNKGARMCIISFHSLEDRIVKRVLKNLSVKRQSRKDGGGDVYQGPGLMILTKKPLIPTEEEIRENPRARSAKLRVAEKC